MDVVVPSSELQARLELHYPKAGNGPAAGRVVDHAAGLFSAAVVYLSHLGAEDALYESPVLGPFAGVDLGRAAVPVRIEEQSTSDPADGYA